MDASNQGPTGSGPRSGIATVVGLVAAVALLGVGLVLVVSADEPQTSRPVVVTDQHQLIWPLDDRGGAWRDDPTGTAQTFGREVLGWEDARVTDR